MRAICFLLFFFMGISSLKGEEIFDGKWQEIKGKHFVVLFVSAKDAEEAAKILRKSEEYYNKVAQQIGFSRYGDFWTWDDRAKIYIFASQEEFIEATSQPAWSRGYVVSDTNLFDSRMIVTYRQEKDFSEGLLPHEISHLILRDFIGSDRVIPIWFDEGVAQLQEADKKDVAYRIMKKVVTQKTHLSMAALHRSNVRKEKDQQKVSLFYAESLTVIDFLLKNYGSSAFGNMCRHFKEGKGIEEAIALSYGPTIKSFEDLEEKWRTYIENY